MFGVASDAPLDVQSAVDVREDGVATFADPVDALLALGTATVHSFVASDAAVAMLLADASPLVRAAIVELCAQLDIAELPAGAAGYVRHFGTVRSVDVPVGIHERTGGLVLWCVRGSHDSSLHVADRSPFVVGRTAGADLQIDDGTISRRHVELAYRDGRWTASDLGTSGGFFMLDRRVDNVPVPPGTVVCFAQPASLVVVRDDPPTALLP
jgi:hypothetical protein